MLALEISRSGACRTGLWAYGYTTYDETIIDGERAKLLAWASELGRYRVMLTASVRLRRRVRRASSGFQEIAETRGGTVLRSHNNPLRMLRSTV